jgi:hypothetical protein
VADIAHDKHKSFIFINPMLDIKLLDVTNTKKGIEIIMIEVSYFIITLVYKPPNVPFTFRSTKNFDNLTKKQIYNTSNFISHHKEWGYEGTNNNGDRVE